MPKKQKLSLGELEIQSFVTTLTLDHFQGGGAGTLSAQPNCSNILCPTDATCNTVEGPCPSDGGCTTIPYTAEAGCSSRAGTGCHIPSMDHC